MRASFAPPPLTPTSPPPSWGEGVVRGVRRDHPSARGGCGMITRLDHVVLAVADLEAAVERFRTLGFSVMRGGEHPGFGTENAIIRFGLDYLELLHVRDARRPWRRASAATCWWRRRAVPGRWSATRSPPTRWRRTSRACAPAGGGVLGTRSPCAGAVPTGGCSSGGSPTRAARPGGSRSPSSSSGTPRTRSACPSRRRPRQRRHTASPGSPWRPAMFRLPRAGTASCSTACSPPPARRPSSRWATSPSSCAPPKTSARSPRGSQR